MKGDLVISVSGVRGIVGESLTPEVAARWAAAHGAAARERSGRDAVVLGRDARTSGPAIAAGAAAGLRRAGCDVLDVGMACTPSILLAVEDERAAGGIAVTASHNPAEWNALKLASHEGIFLTADQGLEVRARVESGDPPCSDREGSTRQVAEVAARHVARILADPLVDTDAIRRRGFRVALDAVHGAGALVMSPLLHALGVSVDGLHLEPSGLFPRDPEPTTANLGELAARVRESGADLGFAIDPDGDRLALVDGGGRVLGEDLTLALCADYVLAERPGPLVTNLSTSQVVEAVAEAHRVPCLRTAVGEVNVALRMREEESPIGGEGNGGVIYAGLHHTRDAPMGAALLLASLARAGRTLAEASAGLPSFAMVRAKLPLEKVDGTALLARAAAAFPEARVDRTDGLRLAWPGDRTWLHVRASGTEPVVRVIAEAPAGDRARALVERVRELAAG